MEQEALPTQKHRARAASARHTPTAPRSGKGPAWHVHRVGQGVLVVPPGAGDDGGVTGGVTRWYREGHRRRPSVPLGTASDVSFPRSTACTACTPFRVHRSL